tara:strand:- start:982 stop:1809 length:828 start_codon:yes stop_codon:yes gene_type:complete
MKGFYGDTSRFFLGIVVNNDDSELNLGRLQIRIFGVHDNWQDIPDWSLPWAQIVLPTTEGGTNGIGGNPMIENGSQVFGFFLDGKDSQLPLVLGTIPKIMTPTDFQQNSFTNCSAALPPITTPSNETGESINASLQTSLVGSTNAEKAFNFMVMNGFATHQAAAMVGNFAAQSGVELTNGSYGIVSWNGDREKALTEYATAINQPITLLETQLGFVIQEMRGSFSPAAAKIRSSNDLATATARAKIHYFEDNSINDVSGTDPTILVARDVYERFV